MPLVVPGINSTGGGDQTTEWQNKLMGKKLGDKTDTVTFAKQDLPAQHRILKPGDMSTMDFKPERLNIHTNDDGTVSKVTHG